MADGGETTAEALDRRRKVATQIFKTTSKAGHGFVLQWGWMWKQGEGGLLHRANWKRRFFVLYKVPQGCVLVYYETMTVDADMCLGFIDLRRCESVKRTSKKISGKARIVMEVATTGRTFYLAPDTVNESLTSPPTPSIQYILGWPVPEPAFGKEKTLADADGGSAAEEAVAAQWLDTLVTLQEAEGRVDQSQVKVLSDSTETLPPTVMLRVGATELALLDVGDRDLAHTCWSYKDISSYANPIPDELHFTVRVPGAMVRAVLKTSKAEAVGATIRANIESLLGESVSAAGTPSTPAAQAGAVH